MNIRNLGGAVPPNQVRAPDRLERGIKADTSHDRDANGQQGFDGEKKQQKPPMSEEQIQEALNHLQELPASKEHKWTVEAAMEDDKKYVLVKDNMGNIIRKIPEIELWSLPIDGKDPKGQLLKKVA